MKILQIPIPKEYQTNVLENCGYKKHLDLELGYVRDIDYKHRWHAYKTKSCIELHLDEQIKGKHSVASLSKAHKIEKMILLAEYDKIKIVHKKMKPQFAKNILELQKKAGSLNKKKTLLIRLKEFFYK